MNEETARRLGLELMAVAEVAYLTTINADGFPQTRALFNLRRKEQFPKLSELFKDHDNDLMVYFSTNTSSAKINHIKENPKVAVYYCLPSEFRGLMLGGIIEIVTDSNTKEAIWQDGWEMYYPDGAHDPDHTVLRLKPSYARYYHRLNAAIFNPSTNP